MTYHECLWFRGVLWGGVLETHWEYHQYGLEDDTILSDDAGLELDALEDDDEDDDHDDELEDDQAKH
eukprot:6158125-Amphidinium_carterae.1